MSTDPNLPLVTEAKGCKYTLIPHTTTHDEVLQIWSDVSAFVSHRLFKKKAVNIPGLGVFTVLKRKLDIGNNGKLCIHRPVFILSEKFAQTHGVKYTKYQQLGEVPVAQLNFAALATDLGIERSVTEVCVKEMIGAFARSVNSQKRGELSFKDIGKLVIKDSKAKMKFSKDFLNMIDNCNQINLTPISLGRPRTSDSFISQNSVLSTPNFNRSTNLVLPKIDRPDVGDRPPSVVSNNGPTLVLSPIEHLCEDIAEEEEAEMPPGNATDQMPHFTCDMAPESTPQHDIPDEIDTPETAITPKAGEVEIPLSEPVAPHEPMARHESVTQCPVAPCTSSTVDLVNYKRHKTDLKPSRKLKKRAVEGGQEMKKKAAGVQFVEDMDTVRPGCSHKSGQELCYLCHQRQKRNQPISFAEEKERYETEQDRILQQYQEHKDQEFYEQENAFLERERAVSKKVAQFNLATSELQKQAKPAEYHHSYIFNRKVESPTRFLTQEEYSKSLGEQVKVKTERLRRLKDATDKLEQNEQRYLATELAASRKQFLESKAVATKQYQAALGTQVKHKPFRLPKAEPDSEGPVFGRMDMTGEKVREMRRRAKEVLSHQLQTIQHKKERKRQEREDKKRYETEVLKTAKRELQQDNYTRFQVSNGIRKDLESSWTAQHREKMRQDELDRKHQMTAGLLLLDQCDKYSRCKQCERCLDNIGTSNVWRESRYISGFRLMV